MLRRLLVNKKLLVIVPLVLVLAIGGLLLPAREVSVDPSGLLSIESKIVISVGSEAAYAATDYEYKKPQSFSEVTAADWSLESQAWDFDYNDTSTAATSGANPGDTSPPNDWIAFSNWEAKGPYTYTATELYVNWGTNGAYNNDEWSIQYTLNGGSNWVDILTLGVYNNTGVTTEGPIDLDADQNLALVQVRLNFEKQGGPDSGVTYIYDIWTKGTYTASDIINAPASINFLTVTESTDYWSSGSAPVWPLDDGECLFTVTNNTAVAVDIVIKATDFSGGKASGGWDIGATAGADIVVLKAGKSGDTVEDNMVTLTTGDQAFITALGVSPSTQKWELKMETPASFSNGNSKSATITLTATLP